MNRTTTTLYYLKYPTEPTFDYDNNTSVEMEWKDEDKLKILARALRTLGVRMNEKQIFEYAQQIKLEP